MKIVYARSQTSFQRLIQRRMMPKIKFGCGLDMDLTAKIAECEGH